MPHWKVLIVDDEALARRNLQLALAEHAQWQLVGQAASAAEARVALVRQAPDLVLLDIRMPREHGLSFAAELATMAAPPLVVFVTAHDEHALAAFEVHALDYLLKPVDDQRLAQALHRAAVLLQQSRQTQEAAGLRAFARECEALQAQAPPPVLDELVLRSVGHVQRIPVADIVWLASAGNYVELHLADRTALHRAALGALEQRLPPGEFLRVHRSALVRPEAIAELQVQGDGVYVAVLRDGTTLPVSERHVQAVRRLFEPRR
ncbi:MAG: LytR/AlgR family response regulator transcription factor [Roseateles sp.]